MIEQDISNLEREVTRLQNAFLWLKKKARITEEPCLHCEGTGKVDVHWKTVDCSACKGTGDAT